MPEMDVNYAAVITATLFSFILGAFWYSPLMFGEQWMAAIGKSEEDLKESRSISVYLMSLLAWFIATYVLANIVNFAGAGTLGNGMIIGFLCWLGFIAVISLMHNMFEKRGTTVWLVNAGYSLVGFLVSGAIFGIWK
jgi:uncharacterized membrane protein required for colicin V production